MKFPYTLASDLCMQIKRALSIHIHKQVLIKTDKQIEFIIHEITTKSNQIIMQI